MKDKPKELRRVSLRIENFNEKGVEIVEHIRKQAKKAREESELSQRELSFQVNRSKGFISKMENGDVEPSVTDLLAMSIILKKPLKYFLPAFSYHKSAEEETTGEEWELLQAFRKIKNTDIRQLGIKTLEDFAQLK